MNQTSPEAIELLRLEVLGIYKTKVAGAWVSDPENTQDVVQKLGSTPFDALEVVRYQSDVGPIHVPGIHDVPRDQVAQALQRVRETGQSEVLMLYGEPGAGKSHVIAWFDRPESKRDDVVVLRRPNTWTFEHFDSTLVDWLLEALLHPPEGGGRPLLENKLRFFGYALMKRQHGDRKLERYVRRRSFPDRVREALGWRPTFDQLRRAHDDACFERLDFARFADAFAETVVIDSNPFRKRAARALMWYLLPKHRDNVVQWMRGQLDPAHNVPFAADRVSTAEERLHLVRILVGLFMRDATQGIEPSGDAGAPASESRVFLLSLDQLESQKALGTDGSAWTALFRNLSTLYNDLPNLCVLLSMPTTLRNQIFHRLERQFQDRVREYQLVEVTPEATLQLFQRRLAHWLGEQHTEVARKLDKVGNPYLPFTDRDDLLAAAKPQVRVVREILRALRTEFRARLDQVRLGPTYDFLAHQQARLEEKESSKFFDDHHEVLQAVLPAICDDVLRPIFGLTCDVEPAPSQEELPRLAAAARLRFVRPDEPSRSVVLYVIRLTSHVTKPLADALVFARSLDPATHLVCITRNGHLQPQGVPKLGSWPGHVVGAPSAEDSHCYLLAVAHLLEKRPTYFAAGASPDVEQDYVSTVEKALRKSYLCGLLETIQERLGAST